MGNNDFLLPSSRKIPNNGLRNRRGWLDGESVQMHLSRYTPVLLLPFSSYSTANNDLRVEEASHLKLLGSCRESFCRLPTLTSSARFEFVLSCLCPRLNRPGNPHNHSTVLLVVS